MNDFFRGSIQGFVKIIDKNTGEILVDTHNDVLYGNLSAALAHSLIGNSNSFLTYMAFGNGGAYVNTTGSISYRPSFGGASSLIKNFSAGLYNTVFVKKLSNDSTSALNYNPLSKAYVPGSGNDATNYEDIVIDVTLEYNEPPTNSSIANAILGSTLDNSTFIGSTSSTSGVSTANQLVFNEIGLFSGTNDIFVGQSTATTTEVDAFINTGTDFSAGAKSKLMLTHVIFHPVQKSANRSLQIIYTLRIQMGAL